MFRMKMAQRKFFAEQCCYSWNGISKKGRDKKRCLSIFSNKRRQQKERVSE